MKKILYLLTFIFLFGSVGATYLLVTNDLKQNANAVEAHADWPDKNFEELVEEADLIAVVKTDNLKQKKIKPHKNEKPLPVQFTSLKVKELIKGEAEKNIVLNQAVDFVEKNTEYLMFLRKGSDGNYYELTGKSIITSNNNHFTSTIEGFEGTFSAKDMKAKINSKLKR